MDYSTLLVAPTFWRAFSLWLATICLGTLFIILLFGFTGSHQGHNDISISASSLALGAGGFAGAFSLPILLLLPFSIKWPLRGSTRIKRYLRLLSLIICLFGLATFLCYSFVTRDNGASPLYGSGDKMPFAKIIVAFAAPYFVAALLAAYGLYATWLNAPPTE